MLKNGTRSGPGIFILQGLIGLVHPRGAIFVTASEGKIFDQKEGSMLKIHQPYNSKYLFAFVSIGVLLLGSTIIINSSSETSIVYAAGDSRTIHDISDMQEMTQQICSNTDIGDTATLKDSRDPNSYTIVKLEDGNCWMQENLRLTGGKTLKSNDSNVSSDWSMPTTLTSLSSTNFSSSDYYKAESYYDTNTFSTNGVYYSFTAATAGAAASSVTSGEVGGVNGNSVCPKDWRLPTDSEYRNMLSRANIGNNADGSTKIRSDKYKFPYAGSVTYGRNGGVGSDGEYWSRTVHNSEYASRLGFDSNNVDMYSSGRLGGLPVRCIALGGLEKIEKPMWEESKDSNINVIMPTVITIDAASGMSDTAETNRITEGTIIAKVTSNGEHEVLLSAVEPSLKDPKVTTAEISPVSSTNPVQPGNNAWGIWNGDTGIYDPITEEAKTYDETITDGVDSQKIHTYQVGISISPALPAGTYATEVTVTSAAK